MVTPFVSEEFNTLNTPTFDGALHIEIVVSLLSHLFFYTFFTDMGPIDLVILAKF